MRKTGKLLYLDPRSGSRFKLVTGVEDRGIVESGYLGSFPRVAL